MFARLLVFVTLVFLETVRGTSAQESHDVKIAYLYQAEKGRLTISILDLAPIDRGLAGAKVAINDNNTTGKFVGQSFILTDVGNRAGKPILLLRPEASGRRQPIHHRRSRPPPPFSRSPIRQGQGCSGLQCGSVRRFAPRAGLPGQCDPHRADLFDAGGWPWAISCLEAVAKLVSGRGFPPRRQALGRRAPPGRRALWRQDRLREGVHRYRRCPPERQRHGSDPATNSGVHPGRARLRRAGRRRPQRGICHLSSLSDLGGEAGRRIGGSIPSSWHPSFEGWGGAQIQNRFEKASHRRMLSADMQAWTAVRIIGEAATRTKSTNEKDIEAYIKSPDFSLAAFKGEKVTLRRLELAAASTCATCRRPLCCIGFAAGGFPA